MNKKECKLVQDLLPNYIEKLTSKESNIIIEEHLNECTECKKILEDMQNDIGIKAKEQCKKETEYMKKYGNKLKIFKLLGLILLIIVLVFIINTTSKYIILNDLYNKAKTHEIKGAVDNYHVAQIGVREDAISYVDEYIKGNKKIRYCTRYSNGEEESIISEIYYEDEHESFMLKDDGKNKTKKNITTIGSLSIQKTDMTLTNSFSTAIWSKVRKIKFRDKECYLVQQYLWEYIIEADTGVLLRMISEYEGKQIIQDYYEEIGTVLDSDVIKPDTTEYVELQ